MNKAQALEELAILNGKYEKIVDGIMVGWKDSMEVVEDEH